MIGLAGIALAAAGVTFTDASSRLASHDNNGLVEGDGTGYYGIGVLDYDGDGDLDLYLPNDPGSPNSLFRNDGSGGFTEVAAAAGVTVDTGTGGVLAVDLDSDGLPELVLPGDRAPQRVFQNLGDGTFADRTVFSGLTGSYRNISGHAADYDGDGDLDVFVGGGIVPLEMYPNTLWRNEGGGVFVEVGAVAGVASAVGFCAGAFTHLDGDDWIDLLVANCNDLAFADAPFEVYRNNGDGTFTDIQPESRIWAVGHFMAIALGDFDNNGWMDLFSTNTGITRNTPHALYTHDGSGIWTDAAESSGAGPTPFAWGAVAADFDNDGWVDLYHAGHSHAPDMAVSPGMLQYNLGDGTFAEAEVPLDLSTAFASGVAWGDFDGNGFVDLVVMVTESPIGGMAGRPVLLLNEGNDNHWLTVQLDGAAANRAGVGARVRLEAGGTRQLREVTAGDSYLSTSSPWPMFGLGDATEGRLCVRWPDGSGEDFGSFPADQAVRLVQGQGVGPDDCGPEAAGTTEPADTGAPDTGATATDDGGSDGDGGADEGEGGGCGCASGWSSPGWPAIALAGWLGRRH